MSGRKWLCAVLCALVAPLVAGYAFVCISLAYTAGALQ